MGITKQAIIGILKLYSRYFLASSIANRFVLNHVCININFVVSHLCKFVSYLKVWLCASDCSFAGTGMDDTADIECWNDSYSYLTGPSCF
jgi:hypothetical protein